MSQLTNVFSLSPAYSILTVAIAGGIGFIIGLLLKSRVIEKHKKRVMNVENEMLLSHSRILELEKELTELKSENAKLQNKTSGPAKLKAS